MLARLGLLFRLRFMSSEKLSSFIFEFFISSYASSDTAMVLAIVSIYICILIYISLSILYSKYDSVIPTDYERLLISYS